MISLCYIIVFVNLIYSYGQGVTFPSRKTWKMQKSAQKLFLQKITAKNQDEYLAKLVSPYWNLKYDEQLKKKQNSCKAIVEMIFNRSFNIKTPIALKLLQIVPSPVTKAYRNRDEFSIRHGLDGNPKTVGYEIGQLTLGRTISVHPTKIVTIKESHKRVAQVYEDFIRSSPIPAHLVRARRKGHWKTLLVRSNEAGDIMASVAVHPSGFTLKEIREQRQVLKEYFFKHLPNITLYHQQCVLARCTEDKAEFTMLYGKEYLNETLNGYKFKISPGSVFLINKFAAEVLYETVIRTAKLNANTIVLDLSSSSGAIGMMASKFVKGVIVFETAQRLFTDVSNNIELNGIPKKKIQLLLGRAEWNIRSALGGLIPTGDIVAIVNHVQPGLVSEVMRTIRSSTRISRIVYFSCRISNLYAIQNFVDLCSKNTSKFPPFTITKVIPVDLLPQTEHVELILVLKRSPAKNI